MSELILRKKDDTSITMTIRISTKLRDQFDEMAKKTGRSRNELIALSLKFALDNMKVSEER